MKQTYAAFAATSLGLGRAGITVEIAASSSALLALPKSPSLTPLALSHNEYALLATLGENKRLLTRQT